MITLILAVALTQHPRPLYAYSISTDPHYRVSEVSDPGTASGWAANAVVKRAPQPEDRRASSVWPSKGEPRRGVGVSKEKLCTVADATVAGQRIGLIPVPYSFGCSSTRLSAWFGATRMQVRFLSPGLDFAVTQLAEALVPRVVTGSSPVCEVVFTGESVGTTRLITSLRQVQLLLPVLNCCGVVKDTRLHETWLHRDSLTYRGLVRHGVTPEAGTQALPAVSPKRKPAISDGPSRSSCQDLDSLHGGINGHGSVLLSGIGLTSELSHTADSTAAPEVASSQPPYPSSLEWELIEREKCDHRQSWGVGVLRFGPPQIPAPCERSWSCDLSVPAI